MRYYIKKPSNNIGKVRSNVTAPWHGTRWLKGLGARLRHAKPCQGISDPPWLVPPCTVPYPRTLAVRFFNEVFSSESSIRSAQVVSFKFKLFSTPKKQKKAPKLKDIPCSDHFRANKGNFWRKKWTKKRFSTQHRCTSNERLMNV